MSLIPLLITVATLLFPNGLRVGEASSISLHACPSPLHFAELAAQEFCLAASKTPELLVGPYRAPQKQLHEWDFAPGDPLANLDPETQRDLMERRISRSNLRNLRYPLARGWDPPEPERKRGSRVALSSWDDEAIAGLVIGEGDTEGTCQCELLEVDDDGYTPFRRGLWPRSSIIRGSERGIHSQSSLIRSAQWSILDGEKDSVGLQLSSKIPHHDSDMRRCACERPSSVIREPASQNPHTPEPQQASEGFPDLIWARFVDDYWPSDPRYGIDGDYWFPPWSLLEVSYSCEAFELWLYRASKVNMKETCGNYGYNFLGVLRDPWELGDLVCWPEGVRRAGPGEWFEWKELTILGVATRWPGQDQLEDYRDWKIPILLRRSRRIRWRPTLLAASQFILASERPLFQACPEFPLRRFDPFAGPFEDSYPAGSAKDVAKCWYDVEPLDHLNIFDKRRVKIAVAVIPPVMGIKETDPRWQGFSYWNFGGPGISGITAGWKNLGLLQTLFPYHTIVLNDVRGTASSEPESNCWDSEWREHVAVGLDSDALDGTMLTGGLNVTRRLKAAAMEFGQRCVKRLGGANGVLPHLGTVAAARDLRNIHTKLCEYVGIRPGETTNGLVNFWGMSWGGQLGHVFTVMFPELVGRMVLDSSVDLGSTRDHTTRYHSKVTQVESALQSLDRYCWQYGIKRRECVFESTDNSSTEWRKAAENITIYLAQLLQNAYSILYNPGKELKEYVERLSKLWKEAESSKLGTKPWYASDLERDMFFEPFELPLGRSGIVGFSEELINCIDSSSFGLHDYSAESILNQYLIASATSRVGAEAQARPWLSCIGFPNSEKAKERIPAPPSTPLTTPKFPILAIGIKRDPTTPQRDAMGNPLNIRHYASAYYLEFDSTGHGSFKEYPWNKCANQIIFNYIQSGTVPPTGRERVCLSQIEPFRARYRS
ncbi:hypothetical protein BJ508DRAFT_326148 [Ascobolus immersus RN42]|uniref:Peptidase S33 tripeptidyl aminopeptidase-like C-terminal domain-containing protein n=1 Tax=Ascobolus immersus RN42 TaxID=1160509 RepID=A0A3N4I6J1_ASCIM|nr:hypothetical protein BJ508DRAFT_326148 [Ascobolus immersus RN42]